MTSAGHCFVSKFFKLFIRLVFMIRGVVTWSFRALVEWCWRRQSGHEEDNRSEKAGVVWELRSDTMLLRISGSIHKNKIIFALFEIHPTRNWTAGSFLYEQWHFISQTNRLLLYREKISCCFCNHSKRRMRKYTVWKVNILWPLCFKGLKWNCKIYQHKKQINKKNTPCRRFLWYKMRSICSPSNLLQ